VSPEEERMFDLGAEHHKLSDKLSNIRKDNVVIPKRWIWSKDGNAYDFEEMQEEFNFQIKKLKEKPMLTDRQRELFQQDKHILVETIITLEDSLLVAMENVKFLENEMLLNTESLKAELEEERRCRAAAEQANIIAQEEIDGTKEPVKLKNDVGFDEKVLRAIGKYQESEVAKDAKEIKEEGEDGTL
jgi:hypothetical protein|tara:strand:- start:480 stop:1040 length:561 start_codon:yes stop_codon:yes gene_type:complete